MEPNKKPRNIPDIAGNGKKKDSNERKKRALEDKEHITFSNLNEAK